MTSSTPDTRTMGSAAWAALFVVYIVWGSTYLGIGIVVETIPPLLSAALRFMAAAVLLGIVLMVRYGPGVLRVSPRSLGSAALVGLLLLAGGNGMVSVAEQHISTGMAALLVSSVPLWLVVFRSLSGDRPPLATVAGVVTGFTGVALLSLLSDGGAGNVVGITVVLLASLSWSIGSFLTNRLPMPGNSFVASVYEMAAGGLALLVVSASKGESFDLTQVSTRSWLALGYLITFGSLVAFTSYVWLLGNAPITLVGTYAYVNPAVAVLLGALVLSEHVTGPTLIGGAVIIVGVGLVVSTERRAKIPAVATPEPVTVK